MESIELIITLLPYIIIFIIFVIMYFVIRKNFPALLGLSAEEASKSVGASIGENVGQAVVGAGKAIIGGTIGAIKDAIPAAKPRGGPCTLHTDCEGYKISGSSLVCDNSTCVDNQKDWKGVWVVPSECMDAPSPLGVPGSCVHGYHWPRRVNEPCDISLSCSGYIALQPTLTCDNNVCKQAVQDWSGAWYPPSVAVGATSNPTGADGDRNCGQAKAQYLINNPDVQAAGMDAWEHYVTYGKKEFTAGTASRRWPGQLCDWQLKAIAGSQCKTSLDCDGYVALQNTLTCDKGTCVQAKKDWTGTWYPPSECVSKAFGPPGIC